MSGLSGELEHAVIELKDLGEAMRQAASRGEFATVDALDRERVVLVQGLLDACLAAPEDGLQGLATRQALELALRDTEGLLAQCLEQQAHTRRALAEVVREGRVALHYGADSG